MKRFLVALFALVFVVSLMLVLVSCNSALNRQFEKMESTTLKFQEALAEIANSVPAEEGSYGKYEKVKLALGTVSSDGLKGAIGKLQSVEMEEARYSQTVGIWKNTVPSTVLDIQIDPIVYARVASITDVEFLNVPMNVRNDGCYRILEINDGYSIERIGDMSDPNATFNQYEYSAYSGTTVDDVAFVRINVQLSDDGSISRVDCYAYAGGVYISLWVSGSNNIFGSVADDLMASVEISYLDKLETYTYYLTSADKYPEAGDSEIDVTQRNENVVAISNCAKSILDGIGISAQTISDSIAYMRANSQDVYEIWNNQGEFAKLRQYVDEYRNLFNSKFDLLPVVEEFFVEDGVLVEYIGSSDTVTIPEDVVTIDKDCAIYGKTLVIPEGLQTIEIDKSDSRYSLAKIQGFEEVIIAEGNDNFVVDGAMVKDKEGNVLFLLINDKLEVLDYSQFTAYDIKEYISFYNKYKGDNHYEGFMYEVVPSVKEVIVDVNIFNDSSLYQNCFPDLERLVLTGQPSDNNLTIDLNANTKISEIVIPEGIDDVTIYYPTQSINLKVGSPLVALRLHNDKCTSMQLSVVPENLQISSTSIESLVVPDGVESLSVYSTSLKQLTVPASVEDFNMSCQQVEKLVFAGERQTIPNVLWGNSDGIQSLKEVVFPQGVTTIGRNAFSYTSIEKIVIPVTVTVVDEGAFANCFKLTEIQFPKSIETIGYRAFYGCSSLKNVDLPEGITSLGNEAFEGCTSLLSATIPGSITQFGVSVFNNCQSLQQVEIGYGAVLGANAFYNCTALESVDLSGVEVVPSDAFNGCTSLVDLTFSEATREICERAFYGCSSLEQLQLCEGLEILGSSAFMNTAVKSLHLPSTLTSVASLICNSEMDEIVFSSSENPLSVSLGAGEYPGNVHIKNITTSDNVTEISIYPDEYNSVYVDNLTIYGRPKVFLHNVTNVVFKDVYQSESEQYLDETRSFIDYSAHVVWAQSEDYYTISYYNDDGSMIHSEQALEGTVYTVNLVPTSTKPATVETNYKFVEWQDENNQPMSSFTVRGDVSLHAVYQEVQTFLYEPYLDGVKILGYTFEEYNPETIEVPKQLDGKKVLAIENGAFSQCTDATTLIVPFIGSTEGGNLSDIFAGIIPLSLRNVVVTNSGIAGGLEWSHVQLVVFEQPVTEILTYAFQNCSSLTNLQMNLSQLQSIGAYAFFGCSVDLELPATLTSIGDNAFDGFSGSVNYLGSVDQWVSIEFGSQSSNPFYNSGKYLFNGTLLENVVISNAVTVNAHCFVNMKNVKSIVISDSVTNIDDHVFAGVQGVESMTFGLAMFGEDSRALGWLFAPEDTVSWTQNINSKFVPQTLTSVTITGTTPLKSGIISSISSLTSVIISSDCTVESWALSNLSNLQHVEVPYRYSVDCEKFGDIFGNSVIHSITSIAINSEVDYINFGGFSNWMSENKQLYIKGSVKTIEYPIFDWQLQDLYFEGDLSQWLSIEFVHNETRMALAQNLYFNGELLEGELVIPEGTTVLPSYAFYFYDKITSIVIPSTVTDLGTRTFYSPVNYERVELNATACSDWGLFGGYESSINELYIGASVQSICDGLFQNTSINIVQFAPGSQCKYIGDNAFYVSHIAQLQLPDSLVSIGDYAFYNAQITELVLPEGVTEIGASAFAYCIDLTSIDLPISLQTVGVDAFVNVDKLNIAKIPAKALDYISVESCVTISFKNGDIGEFNAEHLQYLTFEAGVTSYNGNVTASMLKELHLNVSSQFQASNLNFTSANGYVVYIGEKVQCIYDGWFLDANVTAVVFEEDSNCSYVGQSAFMNSSLVSIELPDSVTSVGDNAFANCSSLTTATLPNGLENISVGMFSGCSSLSVIEIPSVVTVIQNNAFADCSSLTAVTLPVGLTVIDYSAFYGCTGLASIELPEGLLSIGNSAFSDSGLLEVTIPETVTKLDNSAFRYCNSLTSVVLSTNITTIGDSVFSGCASLQGITIPNTVEEIGSWAFYNCQGITEVVIPISVSSIGMYAFEGFSANATIYCEAPVKPTGWATEWTDVSNSVWGYNNVTSNFYYDYVVCDQSAILTKYKGDEINVEVPTQVDGLPVKGLSEIFGDKQVFSVILPDTLNKIHPYAFAGCDSLVNLYIPESVSTVGEKITYQDYNVTIYCQSDSTPEGWHSEWMTDVDVYWGCESILSNDYRYITVDNQIVLVDYYGLAQSIGVPDRIGSLEVVSFSTAFSNNKVLTYVNIPETITNVGKYAFYECSSLGYVRMSTDTTIIDDYAFYNCKQLKDVIIPDTVAVIGQRAFYNCTSIESIVIPISVENIGYEAIYIGATNRINCETAVQPSGWNNFWENSNYVTWGYNNVSSTDFDYLVVDGNAVLTKYTGESTDVVIPSTIDGYSVIDFGRIFRYNYLITSVVIPHGVKQIYENAFYGCSALTSVTIPSSVSYVGDSAFYGCKALTSVTIPSSVTHVGNSAFGGCSSLTSITIPESVTSFGNSVFSNCSGLTTATILANVTSLGSNTFSYCSSLETVQLPQSLTSIEARTFEYCENLTDIVLPDGVEYIANHAFDQCTSLTNIVFPSKVNLIDDYAFASCESLVSVVFPTNAIVEYYAFISCDNLSTVYYCGTSEQWIDSGMSISVFNFATVYYYAETNPFDAPAVTEGNYWHFVDGEVTIWTKQ